MHWKLLFLLLLFCLSKASYAQLEAEFTADTTSSCNTLLVNFTDQSTGSINSWTWEINGLTYTQQNPSVTFSNKGSYTVKLTVSDGTNSDSETKIDYITIYNNPNADFSVSPKNGCEPLTVTFQDNSTLGDAPIRTYKWDFGDGSPPGASDTLEHTYQNKGTYPLSLQITDTNNCTSTIKKDSIQVLEAPVAEFESYNRPDTCGAPYTVNFKNLSQGLGLSYLWDFGDGNISTEFEPSHTFTSINSYTVTLIAIGSNCNDTLELLDYVKLASPQADFDFTVDTICVNDTLTFVNNSTLSNQYRWLFGDGTTSASKSPKKVYETQGLMEVTLIARTAGTDCTDSISKSVFVSGVTADFSIIDTFSCRSEKFVGLTDQSIGSDSLAWIFNVEKIPDSSEYSVKGDSSLFVERFSTTYIELSGNYIFTQIAKNKFGCADTLTKVDSIILHNIGTAIDVIGSDSVETWVVKECGLPPGPSFYGGCLPFGMDFNGLYFGPGNPVSWKWTFGNGDSSDIQDPDPVEYTDTVFYPVELEVVDDSGCVLFDNLRVLGSFKPTADYSIPIVIDTVCYGDTVPITDLSITEYGRHISQFILYGSNEEEDSDQQGHYEDIQIAECYHFSEFKDTGMFDIQQIVFNHGCSDTLYREDQIYVLGPIISGVRFFAEDCNDLRTITFNTELIDATGFEWDFGDSTFNTTELEPKHTYKRDGIYYASLKAWNSSTGCDTLTMDSIKVGVYTLSPLDIVAVDRKDFSDLGNNLCFDLKDTVLIREPNAGIYSRYLWIINGDTIKKSLRTFRHVFKEKGLHITKLETTYLGCDYDTIDTFYVSRPEAKIGMNVLEPCYPVEIEFFDNSEKDTTINDWYWEFGFNDTSILEVDTRTYDKPSKKNAYLRVENIFGCADSVFALNILNSQVFNVSFLEANVDICEGDTVTFRNLSSGSNPSYSWDFGDGTTLDTDSTIIEYIYQKGGTFDVTLTGTDDNGCTIEVEKANLVVVDSAVIAAFTSDTAEANCYPLPVFFEDASMGGTVHSWDWTFGDGASSVLENPFHNYTDIGQFDVSLKVTTKNGCSDSILIPAYIKTNGPTATFSMSTDEACVGEAVSFSITSTSNVDLFRWSFGDGFSDNTDPAVHTYSIPGEYYPTIILTNSSGDCVIEISDTIAILNVFADFSINDDTACVPFTADFTNLSSGENSIQWRFGNNASSNQENPSFNYNTAGSYVVSLSITSDAGCLDTAYKTIEVFPYPNLITTPDTGVCLGNEVVLTASGALTYSWSPNQFLNQIWGSQVISRPDTTITYTVSGRNIADCESTEEIEVFVPQDPINNPLEDTTLYIGESIALNVNAGLGYNYSWSPTEDLSCPDCPFLIAQPLENREYIVDIYDSYGCFFVRDTIEISVIELFTLDIPKAFSPNGDGINDIIFARGAGLKELLSFKIYNRFGEIVFETNDFNQGWDGTFRGKQQNIETYIYTIEALTYGNKTLSKKGNISLLR